MKRSLAVLLTVIALCGLFACASAATVDYVEVTKASSIRDQAGYGGKRIVLAQAGERYAYLGELNGWYKVRVDASTDGYLPANSGKIVHAVVYATDMPSGKATTTNKPVRVTQKPSGKTDTSNIGEILVITFCIAMSFVLFRGFIRLINKTNIRSISPRTPTINKTDISSKSPSTPTRNSIPEQPPYKNGYEYEQYVASQLRKQGYNRIQVTKKSGDFGADIICYDNSGRKIAIQCKCYSNKVGYDAIKEVLSAKQLFRCDDAYVITNSTFTKNATEAAKLGGVKLYERFR